METPQGERLKRIRLRDSDQELYQTGTHLAGPQATGHILNTNPSAGLSTDGNTSPMVMAAESRQF